MKQDTTPRRFTPLLLLIFALPLLSSCVAVMIGGAAVTGVVFAKGDLEANLDAPLDEAGWAVGQSIKQSGYKIIKSSSDETSGNLLARDSLDRPITIKLDSITPRATEISIRVGTWGDEARSREILDAIEASLKKPRGSWSVPGP